MALKFFKEEEPKPAIPRPQFADAPAGEPKVRWIKTIEGNDIPRAWFLRVEAAIERWHEAELQEILASLKLPVCRTCCKEGMASYDNRWNEMQKPHLIFHEDMPDLYRHERVLKFQREKRVPLVLKITDKDGFVARELHYLKELWSAEFECSGKHNPFGRKHRMALDFCRWLATDGRLLFSSLPQLNYEELGDTELTKQRILALFKAVQ